MKPARNLGRPRAVHATGPIRHRWAWCARALALVVLAGGAFGLTAGPAFAAASITVTPNTGLTNGQSVMVTGSGFAAKSIGNVLECNTDKGQPMVHDGGVVNSDISVSCTAPSFSKLVTVDASGNVSATFAVIQGTVGPPCGPPPGSVVTCPTTDSTGGDPVADAAKYPCPPTPAQQAAGDVCTLTYGDQAMDSGVATILFGSETLPSSTTTTAAAAATTTTRPAATTTTAAHAAAPAVAAAASPATSSLASTGPGPRLWLVAIVGFVALYLGSVALALVERPARRRRLLRATHTMATAAAVAASGVPGGDAPARPADLARPAYPRPGSPGLWFDGWEPDGSA